MSAMDRLRIGILTFIVISGSGAESAAQPTSPEVPDTLRQAVVLRIRPTGSPQEEKRMLETLARYLEPRTVSAPAGSSIFDLIRAECGTAKPVHAELFRRLNPDIQGTVVEEERTVALPPCPFWDTDAQTVIPPGSSIATQVQLATGVSGPRTLRAVQQLNPRVGDAAFSDSLLAVGDTIRLPYVVLPTSFELREVHASNPERALDAIESAPGTVNVELDRGTTDLVRDVEPATALAQKCIGPVDAQGWPFSAAVVLAQLQRNRDLRARINAPPREQERILIGIGDTGVSDGETRLPFFVNGKERFGESEFDDDANGYLEDVTGANMPNRRGPPSVEPAYPRRGHGTGVAGLAVGGIASPELAAEVRSRVSVSIMSLIQRHTTASSAGPVTSFTYPKDGIAATLRYNPDNRRVSVLNLSIQSPEEMETFGQAVGLASTLIVIAAGNDGADLDQASAPVYPAEYRRMYPGKIITVAAQNALTPDQWASVRSAPGQQPAFDVLASFTNRGVRTVDLAAPGCQVESIALAGGNEAFTGSSFAAPLVSFTAALLMSEGITSPIRVKNRIIASVDFVPGLAVHSGGVLNVPKALAVFEDIVEMRNGDVFRGRIREPTSFVFNGYQYNWRDVLKVLPLGTTATGETTVRFFRRRNKDELEILEGRTIVRHIDLFDWDAGLTRSLPITEIADLIPAAPEFRSHMLQP